MGEINILDELLSIINCKDLSEVGGGHNQKGVDFQRHWAVMRMFELEKNGAQDFLFLFEAIQDIAELDSSLTPSTICIYQVKKKDRKEWSWNDLTSLHIPSTTSGLKKSPPLSKIKNSPLGKLYTSVITFKNLKSSGRFISNAGCDLPLADGTNVATSLPIALSSLSDGHLDLLARGLETLHEAGDFCPTNLSRIHLEKIFLSPDDPRTYLVGLVHKFLENRSPKHAGQARSLVDSLLAKISPLGAKTNSCKSLADMRIERGYSRQDFISALGHLETIPDLLAHLETWLKQLTEEKMGFMKVTSIRNAAVAIYRRQVMGATNDDEKILIQDCDIWLANHPEDPTLLIPFFEKALREVGSKHSSFKEEEFFAQFALRAIKKCVDPI